MFTTGRTSDNTAVGIVTEDDLATPASGKAKIRFVHASSDAQTFNFLIADSLLDSGVGFKGVTTFKEVPAGTYTVKLNDATSGDLVVQQDNIVLTAGKIYTIGAVGLKNATPLTEQALSVKVYNNN